MTEATATTPAPGLPLTLEERFIAQDERLGHLHALLERNLALLARKGAVTPADAIALTENADRIADVQGDLRDLQAGNKGAMARRSIGQAGEMLAALTAPRTRYRGSRRRDPSDRARVWAVKGFAPAGAAAWAAQHAVQLGAAGAGTAATIALGTALAVTSPPAHSAQHDPPGGSLPAASAPQWTAVPVSPSTSAPAARPDAATAGPVPSAPSPSPSSLPSSAPPPPPHPSPGVLVADSTVLQLGVLGAGSVTLTAEGGPVSWSAPQVAGLEIWPSSGTLKAGESVTVTFRATDQTRSGFAIVGLGGAEITISWPAVTGLVQGLLPSL